jgi:biotin carboxyl carrier protein
MKNYTITVNGTSYDVVVEEKGSNTEAKPAVQAAPAPKKPASSGSKGKIEVKTEAQGKVFKINVKPGQAVKRGEGIIVLEIMKMETPITAPQDGTIKTVEVTEGQQVDNGDLLITMD